MLSARATLANLPSRKLHRGFRGDQPNIGDGGALEWGALTPPSEAGWFANGGKLIIPILTLTPTLTQ